MSELTTAQALRLLERGRVEMEGLVSWGSNYTFLVRICGQESDEESREVAAVYKPRKGERPLWDFPPGTLCLREKAAYLTSEALGWGLVPPTTLREGPHGWGSMQLFIEHDPDEHYFTFQGQFPQPLQHIVLFDELINNADRKGGHVLLDAADRLWSIDHGISFHAEYKLRTVIWDFAGEAVPAAMMEQLETFQEKLRLRSEETIQELLVLLSDREGEALQRRLAAMLQRGTFPQPGPGRHYPWPPV